VLTGLAWCEPVVPTPPAVFSLASRNEVLCQCTSSTHFHDLLCGCSHSIGGALDTLLCRCWFARAVHCGLL